MKQMMLNKSIGPWLAMLLISGVLLGRMETAKALTLTLSCQYDPYAWVSATRWTNTSYNVVATLTDLPSDPPGASCPNGASTSYAWSIVSQTGTTMTLVPGQDNPGATDSYASVTNGNNPPTGFPTGGGVYTVNVKCDATYTTPCGTAHTKSVTRAVNFFIVAPKKVVLNGGIQVETRTGQGNRWGRLTHFPLRVIDNQKDNTFFQNSYSQPYANGLPREDFANVAPAEGWEGYLPNGEMGPRTWGLNSGVPGQQIFDGTGTPMSDFSDPVGLLSPLDPELDPDANVPIAEFDQDWHCMELIPPTAAPRNLYIPANQFGENAPNPRFPNGGEFLSNVSDTTLNRHHLKVNWNGAIRSGDVNP